MTIQELQTKLRDFKPHILEIREYDGSDRSYECDLIVIIECNCKRNPINRVIVNKVDIIEWMFGKKIQDVLDYLDSNDRELLIGGMCNHCFPHDPEDEREED